MFCEQIRTADIIIIIIIIIERILQVSLSKKKTSRMLYSQCYKIRTGAAQFSADQLGKGNSENMRLLVLLHSWLGDRKGIWL